MGVSGIAGSSITGTLSNGSAAIEQTRQGSEAGRFESLLQAMSAQAGSSGRDATVSGVASSQIASNHRLSGDYTQGFYNTYTSEADKTARPQGFAASARTASGAQPVIDKTSELYAQSMELENYMVKMLLSSARNTIQKSSLTGDENSYARDMYEDMLYDNYAEALTKNGGFGLADQIYIELSGQRG